MAISSPPSNAITLRAMPPKARASDAPLSNALDFLDSLHMAGVRLGPAMPEPEALQAAAQEAGISPQQALKAYLAILNYE